ncbi:MAG: hypothetical protein LBB84_00825, partial [Tannerellaceae bacterium]|nr:hypothetical protein [Tannerellaceae bacterium]
MRTMICLVASAIALCGTAQAQSKGSRGKILIAYFSWGGNTMKALRIIIITLAGVLSVLFSNALKAQEMDNKKVTAGRDRLGSLAPKFAELNDDVLFGQVWS